MLKPGGRLAIARSLSRNHINSIHIEAGEKVSNDFLLPSGEIVGMMVSARLLEVCVKDDDEYYIVLFEKPVA